MYFGGIDAPRTYLTLAVVDKSGEVVREKSRVPIRDGEPLLEALEGIRPLEVALETRSFWPWIRDPLQPIYELDGRLASTSANRAVRGALVSAVPSHLRTVPDSSLGGYGVRRGASADRPEVHRMWRRQEQQHDPLVFADADRLSFTSTAYGDEGAVARSWCS